MQQERKSVSATGLELRRLSGEELTPRMWDAFYRFYRNTTGMICICMQMPLNVVAWRGSSHGHDWHEA